MGMHGRRPRQSSLAHITYIKLTFRELMQVKGATTIGQTGSKTWGGDPRLVIIESLVTTWGDLLVFWRSRWNVYILAKLKNSNQ